MTILIKNKFYNRNILLDTSIYNEVIEIEFIAFIEH